MPIDEYIVDFYCHELFLAIEIDGSSHIHVEVQINDIKRQERLESLGVRFIRFDELDFKRNMKEVLKQLVARVGQLREQS